MFGGVIVNRITAILARLGERLSDDIGNFSAF